MLCKGGERIKHRTPTALYPLGSWPNDGAQPSLTLRQRKQALAKQPCPSLCSRSAHTFTMRSPCLARSSSDVEASADASSTAGDARSGATDANSSSPQLRVRQQQHQQQQQQQQDEESCSRQHTAPSAVKLQRAYTSTARRMSARARSFCSRRLSATPLTGIKSEDTASALKMAYMRMLTPAASEADAIARVNAQLAISFMVPLLFASSGAAAAHVAASKAKSAAAAQLADAARVAEAVPVMLVCKRCQQPVHCQVGLDVLQNEALVHEVCVRRGTLQVKINADAQVRLSLLFCTCKHFANMLLQSCTLHCIRFTLYFVI
jgi:hypothetical protein